MAKFKNLAFFTSTIQGIKRNKEEARNLKIADAERKKKSELQDLAIKEKKLELDRMEKEGEVDDLLLEGMKSRISDAQKAVKANDKIVQTQIKNANQRNQRIQQGLNNVLGVSLLNLAHDESAGAPAGSIMPGLDVNFQRKVGPFTFKTPSKTKKSKEVVSSIDKTLGSIQQGGFVDNFGDFIEFQDRQAAIRFAATRLGPDFETKFPKAKEFIDKNFPEPDEFGFIVGETREVTKDRAKNKDDIGVWTYRGNGKWEKSK